MVELAWSYKNLHGHAKFIPIAFSVVASISSLAHFACSWEILQKHVKHFFGFSSCNSLELLIYSMFQLRIAHHLKHWTPDFLSYKTLYSMPKNFFGKCSKFTSNLEYMLLLDFQFQFECLNFKPCPSTFLFVFACSPTLSIMFIPRFSSHVSLILPLFRFSYAS